MYNVILYQILMLFKNFLCSHLMIVERKLGDNIPIGKFHIKCFGTPIRLDRNQNGGGIMLLSRRGIPI